MTLNPPSPKLLNCDNLTTLTFFFFPKCPYHIFFFCFKRKEPKKKKKKKKKKYAGVAGHPQADRLGPAEPLPWALEVVWLGGGRTTPKPNGVAGHPLWGGLATPTFFFIFYFYKYICDGGNLGEKKVKIVELPQFESLWGVKCHI
jgi:hypothetical protein